MGKNGSMAVLAIRKLGDLQRQISHNELRISTLERESADYKEQFSRVSIVTTSLKAQINRLTREHEELVKSIRALSVVLKLVVRDAVLRKRKEQGLRTLKIVLSVIGAVIIRKALFLDQVTLLMLPRNRKTQLAAQIGLMLCLVTTIKGNLENLF